jgi:DNA polymerase III sliding clamp (beta) subunit (PCNA family)
MATDTQRRVEASDVCMDVTNRSSAELATPSTETTGSGTVTVYTVDQSMAGEQITVPHDRQSNRATGRQTEYRIHKNACIIPEMDEKSTEFGELCKLIMRDGLQHRIVLLDGQILDGRARLRACLKVGVEPQFVEFDGGDPIEFVWRENFARRNLSTSQKATSVFAYKAAVELESRRRMRQGTSISVKNALWNAPDTNSYQGSAGRTLDKLAKMANVGHGTMQAVDEVARRAPDLMAAVSDGSVKASTAAGIAKNQSLMAQVRHGELTVTEAAEVVRRESSAMRKSKAAASGTQTEKKLCDPVSKLVAIAVALRKVGPEIQGLLRGQIRNAPGLAKAVNTLGFAYVQLLPLLVQTGDEDAIELARRTIAKLAEIPLDPGPTDPQPEGTKPIADEQEPAQVNQTAAPTTVAKTLNTADVVKTMEWPPAAEMKIVVSSSAWKTAMRHAGLAASTKEGKAYSSKIGEEQLGCVLITAEDGKITFESSVRKFAARHVVPADDVDASIIAHGIACVPVMDLKTIVGKLRANHAISIAFCPTTPTADVSPRMKDLVACGEAEIGIVSPRGGVTMSRCDAFSPAGFLSSVFPDVAALDVVFTGKASCMRQPYADVSFSINSDDPNEVFNKLAIFMGKEEVCFIGANGLRCALSRATADKFDSYACIDEQIPLLIEIEYLAPALSALSNNDPITLAVAHDRANVYIISGNTTYRIAMVNEQSRTNYPPICKIIEIKAGATILIDRQELLLALKVLWNVSPYCGQRHIFAADGKLHLQAQSSMAIKGANAVIPYSWGSDVKLDRTDVVLYTNGLVEGLTRMSGDKVRLMFTPDENMVRIEDETDPRFSYYMRVNPPADPSVTPQAPSPVEPPAESLAALPCCPPVEGAGRV